MLAKGNVLPVKDPNSGFYLIRHPNLKRVDNDITFDEEKNQNEGYDNELLTVFLKILNTTMQ